MSPHSLFVSRLHLRLQFVSTHIFAATFSCVIVLPECSVIISFHSMLAKRDAAHFHAPCRGDMWRRVDAPFDLFESKTRGRVLTRLLVFCTDHSTGRKEGRKALHFLFLFSHLSCCPMTFTCVSLSVLPLIVTCVPLPSCIYSPHSLCLFTVVDSSRLPCPSHVRRCIFVQVCQFCSLLLCYCVLVSHEDTFC